MAEDSGSEKIRALGHKVLSAFRRVELTGDNPGKPTGG
jgi:hypothetical protein